MFFISYGTRTGPVRDPQGCRTAPLRTCKGIDTTRIGKNPARASYFAVRGRTGPVRGPHGLFTGCLKSLNPYGARKLIMHALKLYGPRTGRQNSYGAARGPCGPREWTYDFCSKQPVNSPGTARTGPGSVMWLRHNADFLWFPDCKPKQSNGQTADLPVILHAWHSCDATVSKPHPLA